MIDDALCKALHNGALANSGLSNQHGIVLFAADKHLQQALYFLCAAHNRVQTAGGCLCGEIGAELVKVGSVNRVLFLLRVKVYFKLRRLVLRCGSGGFLSCFRDLY